MQHAEGILAVPTVLGAVTPSENIKIQILESTTQLPLSSCVHFLLALHPSPRLDPGLCIPKAPIFPQ